MIHPGDFLDTLKSEGIEFYSGVPDSLLKTFLLQLQKEPHHYITANEGAAIALAGGYHLATGKTGLVYLQNSGLGNAVNPLTSLVNGEVYSLPMLLMIGWRGRPGKKDEPQHRKMGAITEGLLNLLNIPTYIISPQEGDWKEQLRKAIVKCRAVNAPVALLVEDGSFEEREEFISAYQFELSAEDVLRQLYDRLKDYALVINTGKLGRLFYQINQEKKDHHAYFMNVGAMGHTGSLATALSIYSGREVVVIDGDGSLLMHMGALALAGSLKETGLHYLLLNNGAHQSVGGQPTLGFEIDFCAIALGCGFQQVRRVEGMKEVQAWKPSKGLSEFTEFRINCKMPDKLPRPAESFKEMKEDFMKNLGEHESNHSH